MEARLLGLEELLARAAIGEFGRIEIQKNDPLAAVEFGINMVLESLEDEIDKVTQANQGLEEKVRERTRELQDKLDQLSGKNELISRQRQAIRELSTPVLKLWRQIIAMPIIGVLNSQRSQEITERLLHAIETGQARFAILDITGVEVVDTSTASHLTKVVETAQLLGTTCIVSGIRPEVALTLASLGVDLSRMTTARNLEGALVACLRAMTQDPDETIGDRT